MCTNIQPLLVAIISSAIAALVAIAVVLFTQEITARRQRTDLLTKKLEELFLQLVEVGEKLDARRSMIAQSELLRPDGQQAYPMTSEVYGVENQIKIAMYVRLNFPQLEELQKNLQGSGNDIVSSAVQLEKGEKASGKEINEIFQGFTRHVERLMDAIVSKKRSLVVEGRYAKSYRDEI